MFGKTTIVQFLALALAGSSIAAPAPAATEEDKTISKRGVETVYLANCITTGSAYNLSGMFYYPDGDQSQNGEKPASGNYASVNGGQLVSWEGKSVSGTFGSGITFTSNIGAGSHVSYTWSGTGSNGYRTFNCYKDDEVARGVLFSGSTNWGTCRSIYYCI